MAKFPDGKRARSTVFLLAITAAVPALAQQNPIGDHDAPLGTGGGYGAGSVSPSGQYATALPLDLPPPRGDVPLPLSVTYTGSSQVGEAGLGWSVPFAYVLVSNSVSRRKPYHTEALTVAPSAPERVFLDLGGGPMLMTWTGTGSIYRPFVGDATMELTPIDTVGPEGPQRQWWLEDSAGRRYVFRRIAGLDDPSLWLLTEISDRTRANTVVLEYGAPGEAAGLNEVVLKAISYSPDATGCAKHRVELEYAVPDFVTPGTILAFQHDSGVKRERTTVLKAVDLKVQTQPGCLGARESLTRYELGYEADSDSGMPRLAVVDRLGRGGVGRLPVARYEYGRATNGGEGISFGATLTPTLPDGAATTGSMIDSGSDAVPRYRTSRMTADFTGDGIPDVVYWDGDEMVIARGRVSGAGTTFDTPIPLFPDPVVTIDVLGEQTSRAHRYQYSNQANEVSTWIQVLDWNGDGRLDIVDAKGGRGIDGEISPDYWRVLINVPSASAAGVDWRERHVYIEPIREALRARGHGPLWEDSPLPLSRAQTASSERPHSHGGA